jgi:hypothetical protein
MFQNAPLAASSPMNFANSQPASRFLALSSTMIVPKPS